VTSSTVFNQENSERYAAGSAVIYVSDPQRVMAVAKLVLDISWIFRGKDERNMQRRLHGIQCHVSLVTAHGLNWTSNIWPSYTTRSLVTRVKVRTTGCTTSCTIGCSVFRLNFSISYIIIKSAEVNGATIYLFLYLLRAKQQKHIQANTLNLTHYHSVAVA